MANRGESEGNAGSSGEGGAAGKGGGAGGPAGEAARTPGQPRRPESDAPAKSIRELGEHTAVTYQQSRDAAAELVQTTRQRIREKPLQSVLIAAGVGVLVGIIWR